MAVSQLPKLKARVRFPSPAPFLMVCAFFIAGCATTEYKPVPNVESTPAEIKHQVNTLPVKKSEPAVYHKVAKGQTLFRIAKAYGVAVEDIIKSNNIPNAGAIEVNQLILIPGAQKSQNITEHAADDNKEEFAWPIKGKVLSYFNDRHGEASNHGVDIAANEGDAVKASREGQVVLADYVAGYGQTLMLDHGDGFISVYAQNRKLLSKVGDHVYKGDLIAEVGRVGRKSFEHFELRKGDAATNPLYYLP